MYRADAGHLRLAQGKAVGFAIHVGRDATDKELLGADWIARETESLTGLRPTIVRYQTGSRDKDGRVLLGVHAGGRSIDKLIAAQLDRKHIDILSDPSKTEQAYVLVVKDNAVVIMGRSEQGTLYGAMTLLQLLEREGNSLRVRRADVCDWPDFRYRIAENWTYAEGRDRAGAGWCYDWGDGRKSYEERVERVFDRCLRYKINAIMFHGDFYGPLERMWDWRDLAFARRLNRSARTRGIKLIFGGTGVGGKNRRAYPDGEVYECVGYPKISARTPGTCRGNEPLNAIKKKHVRAFVENLEPGGLYIHFEDIARYRQAVGCWKLRCDACRKRWPNDELNAVDGGAAGFAHGYNVFCEAVFSVKNPDSGYDASRDCLVMLVSPGYTIAQESDEDWDKQLGYWTTVSNLLDHTQNVNICIREQFLRQDDNKKRVAQMANALRSQGKGHGVFVFSLSFASLYSQGPLFQTYPAVTNEINKGAETIYFFCGRIFQEPQILLNADWMWNCTERDGSEVSATAKEFLETFNAYRGGKRKPRAIHQAGGYLEKVCTRLYGAEAGRHMKRLYELDGNPVAYGRKVLLRREGLDHDWRPHLEATRQAVQCVRKALASKDLRQESRWILERFLQALELGERFARIRVDCQELTTTAGDDLGSAEAREAKYNEIIADTRAMDDFIAKRFPKQWSTPRGGDFRYWHLALEDTRKALTRWLEKDHPEAKRVD